MISTSHIHQIQTTGTVVDHIFEIFGIKNIQGQLTRCLESGLNILQFSSDNLMLKTELANVQEFKLILDGTKPICIAPVIPDDYPKEEKKESCNICLAQYYLPIADLRDFASGHIRQVIPKLIAFEQVLSCEMKKLTDHLRLHLDQDSGFIKCIGDTFLGYEFSYTHIGLNPETGKINFKHISPGAGSINFLEFLEAIMDYDSKYIQAIIPNLPTVYQAGSYASSADHSIYSLLYESFQDATFREQLKTGNFLDIATGTGVLAWITQQYCNFHNLTPNFIAYDANPFAVANAQILLNDIAGLKGKVMQGQELGIIAGQHFDLVTANSPYLKRPQLNLEDNQPIDLSKVKLRSLHDCYQGSDSFWIDLQSNLPEMLRPSAYAILWNRQFAPTARFTEQGLQLKNPVPVDTSYYSYYSFHFQKGNNSPNHQ